MILSRLFVVNDKNNNDSSNNPINDAMKEELDGMWYEDCMTKFINAGIVLGKPDGLLHPDDICTRAEMVTLINRVTNRDITNNIVKQANIKVSDVSEDEWYYADIVSAMLDY